MNYYAKVAATSGGIVCIFRYSPDPADYVQDIWNSRKNSWEFTNKLSMYLANGEPTLEMLTESEAKKAFPEAF
jgi:hypothetical protein